MEQHADDAAMKRLEPFIGEWTLEAHMPQAPPLPPDARARAVFEWLSGQRFVVQRWEVPVEGAPDGIAIIGYDREREHYVQHYFDSRGVARLYEMSFDGVVWELRRESADFSPLDFRQRFRARFSDDGRKITGSWDLTDDRGAWQHDFDLTYTKVG